MKHNWHFIGNTNWSSFYICSVCGELANATQMIIADKDKEECNVKIGMVSFADKWIYTEGMMFLNLHGWFKPPAWVRSYWASACYIYYKDEADYQFKATKIRELHEESVQQFWSMMAL